MIHEELHGVHRRTAVLAALVVLCAAWSSELQAQERVAVDRWLVSSPFPVAEGVDGLAQDRLAGPGETGVLPDRGRTVAGADWTLVRQDSTWLFTLPTRSASDTDSTEPGQVDHAAAVVAYAHAYIKSPADRTLRLVWGGQDCTRTSAWLNGRPIDELGQEVAAETVSGVPSAREAVVRIGFGYNTLLLKAASGDCPFGRAAGLGAIAPGSLDGVIVRASRPYGDTRTGPAQWIVSGPTAGPETVLGWQGDQLFGAAAVRLAAFSVTAVEGAELKAKVSGRQIKRRVEWLEPAKPRAVLVPFEFENLRKAVVRGESLELELEWDGGEWKGMLGLEAEPLLEAFVSPIRLLGWSGPRAGEDTGVGEVEGSDDPHPLANVIPLPKAGETIVGEWKVPGWLSGFSLTLDTRASPGEYRLASLPVDQSEIVLCGECRKGETVQLVVEATGDWSEFPGVTIMGAAPVTADGATGGATAVEWLQWIDDKGSRKFRERAGNER